MTTPNDTISYEIQILDEVRCLREKAAEYEPGSLMYDSYLGLADEDVELLRKHHESRTIPCSCSNCRAA